MDRRALQRLGHHVVCRRVNLGYRNRTDLANSLQFTVRTLADIEHGVRKASPGTYAILENELSWAPGSIDTIQAGGEPNDTVVELRRTTHNPLSHTPTDGLSRASTEELLLELRRRTIAPRAHRCGRSYGPALGAGLVDEVPAPQRDEVHGADPNSLAHRAQRDDTSTASGWREATRGSISRWTSSSIRGRRRAMKPTSGKTFIDHTPPVRLREGQPGMTT